MARVLHGISIDSLPAPGELEPSDQIVVYKEDTGAAYRVSASGIEATANANISDGFTTGKSYSKGDYVIYNDTLYVFTAAKSAGDWDESAVEATSIASELSDTQTITSGTGTINSDYLTTDNLEISWTKVGKVVSINLCLRTIQATTGNTTTLATGFPKAQHAQHFTLSRSGTQAQVVARINTSGNVTTYYSGNLERGYDYRGGVTYITSE